MAIITFGSSNIELDISPGTTVSRLKERLAATLKKPFICLELYDSDSEILLSDNQLIDNFTPLNLIIKDEYTALEHLPLPEDEIKRINLSLPQFQYSKKTSADNYSYTPSGPMDVERNIQGLKSYLTPASASELDKKTFIFADWTAEQWDGVRIQEVNQLIADLLNEQFPIYIWQDGRLTPLKGPLTEEHRQKMTPVTTQTLQHEASLKGISANASYIVGMCELQSLFDDPEQNHAFVKTSHYKNTSHNKQQVLEVLQQASIQTIACDDLDRATYRQLAGDLNIEEYCSHFDFIKLNKENISIVDNRQYQLNNAFTLVVNNKDNTCLKDLNTHLFRSHHQHLFLTGGSFSSRSDFDNFPLTSLKTLALEHMTTFFFLLSQILSNSKSVTHLSLAGYKEFPDNAFTYHEFPTQLTTLNLSSSNITTKSLYALLEKNPNIKVLDLSGLNLEELRNLPPLSLEQVEYLNLKNTKIPPSVFQALFKNSNHVKHLNLSGSNLDLHEIDENNLQHLEYLDVSHTQQNKSGFLVEKNNLKTLILDKVHCKNSFLKYDLSLHSLEELSIKETSFKDPNTLDNIIYNTLNGQSESSLKTLFLKNCEMYFNGNLSNLETLHIENVDIRSANALFASKKLKKLTLKKQEYLYLPSEVSLSSLENLVCDATIHDPTLITKTANANNHSNLRSLHFQMNIKTLRSLLNSNITFPLLEELEIRISCLESNDINQLFNRCKQLKHLKLPRYFVSPKAGDFQFDALLSLESLQVGKAYNPDDDIPSLLTALLKAAPNLKQLELHQTLYDKIRREHFELQDLLKNIPELIISNSFITSEVKEDQEEKIPPSFERTPEAKQPHIESKHFTDPIHNHRQFMHFKPKTSDFNFQFRGINKTKNQGMLIEKLSQYIATHEDYKAIRSWIPHLQDGICNALVHYCASQTLEEWDVFISTASDWDGYTKPAEIDRYFNALISEYLPNYHFNYTGYPTFIGDNLENFLTSYKDSQPLILNSPWHSITIRRENNRWFVYDPNHIDGGRELGTVDLLKTIHNSLGTLVSVNNLSAVPRITNPNEFIAQGGVLALAQCANRQAMLSQVAISQLQKPFTQSFFDGLFIRWTNGTPAWLAAQQVPELKSYVDSLLEAYKQANPTTCAAALNSSTKDMLPADSHPQVPQHPIKKTKKTHQEVTQKPKKEVKEHKSTPPIEPARLELPNYDAPLQTWSTESKELLNLEAFYASKLQKGEKHLIEVKSDEESHGIQAAMHQYCQDNDMPIFRVHSPDNLVCAAPYIEMLDSLDQRGIIKKGPGGPLYEFFYKKDKEAKELKQDKPRVVLVDYDSFDEDDKVNTNTLLDTQPSIDDIKFPKSTIVIGITNPTKSAKPKDASLYSRFKTAQTCPVPSEEVLKHIPKPPQYLEAKELNEQAARIHLFESNDWKGRLLGRWVPKERSIYFKKGELIEALESGKKPIILDNAPWDNPAFLHFWQHICLDKCIKTPEKTYAFFPEYCFQTQGYPWNTLVTSTKLQWDNQIHPAGCAINPHQLHELFERYLCTEPTLDTKPGRMQEHADLAFNTPMHCNLTRELSEHEWAKCLHEASRLHLSLQIHCAPGVKLPSYLTEHAVPYESKQEEILWKDKVFVSTDIAATLATLETDFGIKPDIKIPISELHASDLLQRINGQLNEHTMEMSYKNKEQEVLRQLRDGKTVILHGTFSPELRDALAAFTLSRQADKKSKGQLILVSDEEVLSFLPQTQLQVGFTQKSHLLQLTETECKELGGTEVIKKEPLGKLKTRLKYLRKGLLMEDAWKGMDDLPSHIKLKQPLDYKNSAEEARNFRTRRLHAVNAILKEEPYVYLTGLTAVGKTTFVIEQLAEEIPESYTKKPKLYRGESDIKKWAKNNKPNRRKILFIDEANLSAKEWTEMEGLFDTPPGIYIDGKFRPLSPDHKIIFAGNPRSYGGNRKLAPFFQHHGNALLFEPLPLATIYEEILKPIFENTGLESQAAALCDPILKYYIFLCEKPTEKVLISARELQTMALLISSYCTQYPDADMHKAAEFYAYDIAKSLVPERLMADFNQQFPKPLPIIRAPLPEAKHSSYQITPSRQAVKERLDDLLELRQHRRRKRANVVQQFGGLGGFVLYGEPGVGKSELIAHTLLQHSYTELKFPLTGDTTKAFCKISVKLGRELFQQRMLEAAHAGVVAIVDEFNTAPVPEQFMNDLLMGYIPQQSKKTKKSKSETPVAESKVHEVKEVSSENPHKKKPSKKRLAHPGFLMIGMGNPPSMLGRTILTTASERRNLSATLAPLPEEEMHSILRKKGVGKFQAAGMVASFSRQLAKAKKHNYSPQPCFRNLMELANRLTRQLDFAGKIKQLNEDIAFGDTKLMDSKYRLINKRIHVLSHAHPQLKDLFSSIRDMKEYGQKITDHRKGQDAVRVAEALNEKLTVFFSSKQEEDIEQECTDLLQGIEQSMAEHRKKWKVIVYNIGVALTGIGTLALLFRAGEYLYNVSRNKPTSLNQFMFFGETISQIQLKWVKEDLQDVLKSIAEDKAPKNNG